MNKYAVLVVATMLSASAFASKARVSALAPSSTKANDIQDIFDNPSYIVGMGSGLTIEMPQGTSLAEGGFFRTMGDATMGVYFGHKSESFSNLITTAGTTGGSLLDQQNPIEFTYGAKAGSMTWGAGLVYSAAENKTSTAKVNTTGVRAGVSADDWRAFLSLGLAGKSEVTGKTATSTSSMKLGGQYALSDVLLTATVETSGGKVEVGTSSTDGSKQVITLGAETKVKADMGHFFYGAMYNMSTTKSGSGASETKDESSKIPFYAGIEADAASWLTLRTYVQQSFLMNNSKTTTGGSTSAEKTGLTGTNDTTAGFGAGLKFGKLIVDGTLTAGTDGKLNTTTLLTNTSLTYTF